MQVSCAGLAGSPAMWLASVMVTRLPPDTGLPPSTVFAAFNHYAGPKQIAVYEFNGHQGGGTRHLHAKLDFLAATLSG